VFTPSFRYRHPVIDRPYEPVRFRTLIMPALRPSLWRHAWDFAASLLFPSLGYKNKTRHADNTREILASNSMTLPRGPRIIYFKEID